jgi:hypothetical protein
VASNTGTWIFTIGTDLNPSNPLKSVSRLFCRDVEKDRDLAVEYAWRFDVQPEKPKRISPYARACLEELVAQGCGGLVSVGGALGLSYFLEYRDTFDVDAWWASAAQTDRRRVVEVLENKLGQFGTVRTRAWGEVVSVELIVAGKVVFGFQIASRSAALERPLAAPWPEGLLLDSLDDLLASKMTALVERGAPRDFRDIYAVCQAGLVNPERCWTLWKRRGELAGEEVSPSRAQTAILTHLERIELHRPTRQIADTADRAQAERLRQWFREVFVHAAMA